MLKFSSSTGPPLSFHAGLHGVLGGRCIQFIAPPFPTLVVMGKPANFLEPLFDNGKMWTKFPLPHRIMEHSDGKMDAKLALQTGVSITETFGCFHSFQKYIRVCTICQVFCGPRGRAVKQTNKKSRQIPSPHGV